MRAREKVTVDTNLDLVDRYGLPLVILALIVLGVWRGWRFLRPFIRETLEEHIQLIKGLQKATSANTVSLEHQANAMRAHAEALALNTAFLRKIYDSVLPITRPEDGPPRLLIVEDSPTDYLLLRKRLDPLADELGFEMIHAGTLAEAIRQIDLVDAIVLDILLPDANDPRTNRLFAELTQLPIVLHTGSDDEAADELARKIGAQIVRKDQPPEVLNAAIMRMFGTPQGNSSE